MRTDVLFISTITRFVQRAYKSVYEWVYEKLKSYGVHRLCRGITEVHPQGVSTAIVSAV
jgi:hypothetical protein